MWLEWLPSHYDEVASELNIGKNCRFAAGVFEHGRHRQMRRMKRRFPYEEHNKWSRDVAEKRRWTEALEKSGPKRVEEELSNHVQGSSALINWAMWAVIIGFVVGIAAIAISISMN